MNIITGKTGTPHITSQQDRELNMGMFGEGSYVLPIGEQFSYEQPETNKIRIKDGILVYQGTAANITAGEHEDITISNGTQGQERYTLIVARYKKETMSGNESFTLEALDGTPGDSPELPAYEQGDIRDGAITSDFPLYRVHLTGITIDEVLPMFNVVGGGLFSANKVLWSGTYWMNETQTAELSSPVSAQKNGIVLVFSRYETESTDNDFNWQCFFIPKYFVNPLKTTGHTFFLCGSTLSNVGTKYLYIRDSEVRGNVDNTKTGTNNGITYANNKFALRYVLGV